MATFNTVVNPNMPEMELRDVARAAVTRSAARVACRAKARAAGQG